MNGIDAVERLLGGRDDVRLAYVFGSAGTGRARSSSDLDVAVLFQDAPDPRELDRLVADLQVAAERRVDLVVLNSAAPLIAHEVIKTGRVIVRRNDDERVAFEARAIARYLDTAHLRAVQRACLHEWAEAYRARSA